MIKYLRHLSPFFYKTASYPLHIVPHPWQISIQDGSYRSMLLESLPKFSETVPFAAFPWWLLQQKGSFSTGNLDSKNADAIMDIFESLNRDGLTVMIVTHNPELAKACKRVITLRDGKVV